MALSTRLRAWRMRSGMIQEEARRSRGSRLIATRWSLAACSAETLYTELRARGGCVVCGFQERASACTSTPLMTSFGLGGRLEERVPARYSHIEQ